MSENGTKKEAIPFRSPFASDTFVVQNPASSSEEKQKGSISRWLLFPISPFFSLLPFSNELSICGGKQGGEIIWGSCKLIW